MEERLFKKDKTVTLAGRYKLVRAAVLGEGSFAVVYKGLDTKDCKNVAIKVYKGSDDQSTEMFTKSIEVLKVLNRHGRNSLRESLKHGDSSWQTNGFCSTYNSEADKDHRKSCDEEERPRGMLLSPRRMPSESVTHKVTLARQISPSDKSSDGEALAVSPTAPPSGKSTRLRPSDSPALTPRPDGHGRGGANRSSFQCSLLEEDLQTISHTDAKFHSAVSVLSMMDWGRCFVKLLSFSRSASNEPGLDKDADVYFLVFELGEESLEDTLTACSESEKTLTVPELRDLQWALVSIVCGLHSEGFVHLDIKPRNIMKFKCEDRLGGTVTEYWKLIDLDGAMRTGQTVNFEELVFTPEYVSPELAKAHTTLAYDKKLENPRHSRRKEKEKDELKLSRLMDVWSVGMCALEAIFLQPVLEPWYQEWRADTGSDEKFFRWLADYETDAVISGDMRDAISGIDSEMCEMLEGMLNKDPNQRVCVAQCITHRWFQPIRDKILANLRETPIGEASSLASAFQSEVSDFREKTSQMEVSTPRSGNFQPSTSKSSAASLGKVKKHSQKVAKIASAACSVM